MVVPRRRALTAPVRRLLVVVLVLGLGAGSMALGPSFGAGAEFPDPVPAAECGPGALPEVGMQGRVPASEFSAGRHRAGYQCNAALVAHHGRTGGFKVQRYTDRAGNVCAYYDSTTLLPKDTVTNALGGPGLGVVVLDMNDPARPRQTANLVTPAMLSPHESLLVNAERGLLAAVMGTPLTAPGIIDLYDISQDCRKPKLQSSTLSAILGHESGFAPDGRTFYAAGAAGTFSAIDVTDPKRPRNIFNHAGVVYHGLRLSADGRTMYVANMTDPSGKVPPGLRILDVSEIQDRVADPEVSVISDLSWREVSIPQSAEPFTRDGRQYVLETDEFSGQVAEILDPTAIPGAARVIDVTDPKRPRVVSDLRLEVHQPEHRRALLTDPGAAVPVQGYAAHYCSLPTSDNPTLVACSMILSGLRIFDISDLENPREVAYFNRPSGPLEVLNFPTGGAFAMSQPAWDVERDQVWYTDANQGFHVVQLTNGVTTDAGPRAAPRFKGAKKPRIRGKKRVGRTLRVKHLRKKRFTPRPDRIVRQWLRNGKPIKGATRLTYRVRPKDRGKGIKVRLTLIRSGHANGTTTTRKVRIAKRS